MTYLNVTSDDKRAVCEWMTENLPELRTRAGMTREELAGCIGITRQNYSDIESKRKEISWSILLSLLFVFESNQNSKAMLDEHRDVLFPVFKSMNSTDLNFTTNANYVTESIINGLDERAKENLVKLLNIEEARCNAKKDGLD